MLDELLLATKDHAIALAIASPFLVIMGYVGCKVGIWFLKQDLKREQAEREQRRQNS